ncbi:MAG TPA: hypothetical protein VF773_00585 [Verrucomicrobiae bacterium]
MKVPIELKAITVALSLLLTGCSTLNDSNQLVLQVQAPPGTKFTCHYKFSEHSGSIKTATTAAGDATFLSIPIRDGSCEITKQDPVILKAIITESGKERFSFRSATNTPAFRLIRSSGDWRTEVIR